MFKKDFERVLRLGNSYDIFCSVFLFVYAYRISLIMVFKSHEFFTKQNNPMFTTRRVHYVDASVCDIVILFVLMNQQYEVKCKFS